ncbi:hypothetical protein GCM10010329_05990 [Streptomyces spiroverticillatus]|uniref:Uncharacterized protein n=1 Tax=Streptomyces finlayi TaxID=67296 RepID=A0A918WT14_9ACTN|nr:hypothetical protein [Streptomyces finlayi]GGZ88619.1 hypothetical protein GCM10010329_05990 [Streptomyces spiroverticillatus]GHC79598.1 hypothetical protein GCM10010334_05970 [Streptomyces finlayi]
MPRPPLPPPPPPVPYRTWPDPEAMRADRERAMRELGRRALGVPAAVGFWLYALLLAVGWGCVGVALQTFEQGMFPDVLIGGIFLVLGVGAIVPAAILLGLGVKRDRTIRQRLCAWQELGADPAVDAQVRAPGRSLAWLLPSFALAALGLGTSLGWAASASPGTDTYADAAFFIGAGCVMWVVGLLGMVKAVGHYRWAVRVG